MNSSLKSYLAELVGTFTLIFIGAGAICMDVYTKGGVGLLGIAIAHGLALSIAVSATMNISGGHINPAVTIAMLITRKISAGTAIMYIISQLIGGALGAIAVRSTFKGLMIGNKFVMEMAKLGTPTLTSDIGFKRGCMIEAFLTFLLLFAIFGTAVDKRAPKLGGFGIGLVLTMDILVGGGLTGAAMNPARAFGPALVGGYWDGVNHLVYWIGPIVGGSVAALLYNVLIMEQEEEEAGD